MELLLRRAGPEINLPPHRPSPKPCSQSLLTTRTPRPFPMNCPENAPPHLSCPTLPLWAGGPDRLGVVPTHAGKGRQLEGSSMGPKVWP